MNGVYFTELELKAVDLEHLQNVADYLEIEWKRGYSKAKLIQLILQHQVENQPYLNDTPPEIPRYSVRVQRIMDSMKGSSQ